MEKQEVGLWDKEQRGPRDRCLIEIAGKKGKRIYGATLLLESICSMEDSEDY